MSRKHGPEAEKTWVHLTPEDGHLFDQTNGLAQAVDDVPDAGGTSDGQRILDAAIITQLASGPTMGGF